MSQIKYKHLFRVSGNKFIWDDKEMFEAKKRMLEGKRGYAIIEEEETDTSPEQYAYYFGGIIRKECMNSEEFSGLSEKQIHVYLLSELRSETFTFETKSGERKIIEYHEDFKKFSKKKMAEYIQEVIAFLQIEHNIHPKPAEHYKYNRFYIDPKTYR